MPFHLTAEEASEQSHLSSLFEKSFNLTDLTSKLSNDVEIGE